MGGRQPTNESGPAEPLFFISWYVTPLTDEVLVSGPL